jgi:hypothetical protein
MVKRPFKTPCCWGVNVVRKLLNLCYALDDMILMCRYPDQDTGETKVYAVLSWLIFLVYKSSYADSAFWPWFLCNVHRDQCALYHIHSRWCICPRLSLVDHRKLGTFLDGMHSHDLLRWLRANAVEVIQTKCQKATEVGSSTDSLPFIGQLRAWGIYWLLQP